METQAGTAQQPSIVEHAADDTPLPSGAALNNTQPDAAQQTDRLFINEPLCYLANKIEKMPADILVKLCVDFYTDEQIDEAKSMLYDACSQMGLSLPRMVKRRGAQKRTNDLNDIVHILLELESESTPTFLARDLTNLPPLSYNHFDLRKILQDIEVLKNEMAVASQSHADIMHAIRELKQRAAIEVESAVATIAKAGEMVDNAEALPRQRLATARRRDTGASEAPAYMCEQNAHASRHEYDTDDSATAVKELFTPRPTVNDVHNDNIDEEDADGDDEEDGDDGVDEDNLVRLHAIQQGTYARVVARASPPVEAHAARTYRNTRRNRTLDNDSSNDVIIGEARSSRLKTATRGGHTTKRTPIGVFVTRLHRNTSTHDIDGHVRDETGRKVTSEQLATKYNTYASFLIRCHGHIAGQLLDTKAWPKGVLVKRFFEKA